MNGVVLALVYAVTMLLLLGYLAVAVISRDLPRLFPAMRSSARWLTSPPRTKPVEQAVAMTVEGDASRWTALDDQQVERFLRDAPQ
jgi:hypothetical protein